MPDNRRATCRVCGGHRDDVGAISWRGKCGDCGERLNRQSANEQHYHSGPVFDHWRERIAASVGAVIPNDETR